MDSWEQDSVSSYQSYIASMVWDWSSISSSKLSPVYEDQLEPIDWSAWNQPLRPFSRTWEDALNYQASAALRCAIIKEELMVVALRPERVASWRAMVYSIQDC